MDDVEYARSTLPRRFISAISDPYNSFEVREKNVFFLPQSRTFRASSSEVCISSKGIWKSEKFLLCPGGGEYCSALIILFRSSTVVRDSVSTEWLHYEFDNR
jgi:hypothetical protein